MATFRTPLPFTLESGDTLPYLTIAYRTYGQLNAEKNNVIWVCHALTGNADADDWWSGLIGTDQYFDPQEYFIVCANMIGSCYGSTGPNDLNPNTNQPYGGDFPLITIRDMVHGFILLADHIGIEKIKVLIGGSTGGQQVCEWAIIQPTKFDHVIMLATNAQHSPWGIAFNETQRMALRADMTLFEPTENAGKEGLKAARAIAMLSYRNYQTYQQTQAEQDSDKYQNFRASSYQEYQGEKLWKRFSPWSYYRLTEAMDSHNVGRKRGGIEAALATIKAKTLVIGIQSDILFPVEEQIYLAENIPNAQLEIIDSIYGHDGFLVEFGQVTEVIKDFMLRKKRPFSKERHFKETYQQGVHQFEKTNVPGTEIF